MANLDFEIRYAFSHSRYFKRLGSTISIENLSSPHFHKKFITIPIKRNSFEVPLFTDTALLALSSNVPLDTDNLIIPLQSNEAYSGYQTLSAGFRNTISALCYRSNGFVRIDIPDSTPVYASNLSFFDNDFNPLAMNSLKLRRYPEGTQPDERFPFYIEEAIYRVSPKVMLNKSNVVEKFIVNKIIPSLLKGTVCVDRTYSSLFRPGCNYGYMKVKIILEDWPYTIDCPTKPDITTSNEKLMDVVKTHIDELIFHVQCQ